MVYKVLFILLFLFVSSLFPQGTEELFSSANKFYQQKEYNKALHLYTELINEGYEGVSLFYNTGNTYYRLGKTGYAILYYEKALRLSPGDEDIQHNLSLAYARTTDKLSEFPSFFIFKIWEDLLGLFSLTGWVYVTYILYILLILATAGYLMLKDPLRQKYSFLGGLVIAAIFIFSTAILIVKLNSEVSTKKGVVVEQASSVKLSPDEGSNDAFVVHEGLKIKLEDRVGEWYKIRLEDGKTGWIQEEDIRII